MTQQTLTIGRREFKVSGPTAKYHSYILTGPRGAEYAVVPFSNAPNVFRVLTGRYWLNELYISGNRVILTDADGTLRVR